MDRSLTYRRHSLQNIFAQILELNIPTDGILLKQEVSHHEIRIQSHDSGTGNYAFFYWKKRQPIGQHRVDRESYWLA